MIRILSALRFLAWPVLIVLAWFTGQRGAKRDAALKDAQETLRRIQTREEIEDAVESDVDLVARAKRIGLVQPK